MPSERSLESHTGGRAATTGVIQGDIAISVGNPKTPLPDGWQWRPLSDLARLETGHTPSRKHPEYWGGDVPWIGIKDASGNHGRTIQRTIQYTNELGIRNSSARILPANTVCLSRTASVGFVVVMGVPMATSQDFVNWVCGPELDYRYLKYVLLAERDSFLRFASGTTHQTIYFPEVKAFHVALPSLSVQREIANTLSALDDRIANLEDTNRTLESIVQALFKSWFVDFDPVRAKAEGREPEGVPPEVAELFPNKFEESELGEIPNGWGTTTVGVEYNLVMGQSPPGETYNQNQDGLPFFQGRTDFGFRYPTNRVYCIAPTRYAEGGDTLISVRAPVGDVNMALDRCSIGRGVASARHKTGSRSFTYYSMRFMKPLFDKFESEGTVFGSINKKDFEGLKAVHIPDALVNAFESLVCGFDSTIHNNEQRVTALTSLRDSLLPRMMSGKLRPVTVSA